MKWHKWPEERPAKAGALTQDHDRLRHENAALAAALEQRKSCKRCGGTGRYLAYPPTMYETDTDEERDNAIRMAERPCPDCTIDPKAILAAHDAAVRQKVLLDEWEHDWPVIFQTIADEKDEKLTPDAQATKRRILEAVENSAWLKAHDAEKDRQIAELAAALDMRPEVLAFARAMEHKLRRNDHKKHWSGCSPEYLLSRLDDEVKELKQADSPGAILDEAVDVANFAMMIADHSGELKVDPWNMQKQILSAHDAAVRKPLLEALRNLRNLAVEASNADVACALSEEPGSTVFGSSGCASKSALATAKQAWKRIDNCVDEILSRYTDDGREKK